MASGNDNEEPQEQLGVMETLLWIAVGGKSRNRCVASEHVVPT